MRRAREVIAVAAVLDIAGGGLFAIAEHLSFPLGVYWAVTTATTVGYGDIAPHTAAGHVIAIGVMLSVIPLFAATFSLLTSGLTATHVKAGNEETHRLIHHVITHSPDIPEVENP